MIGQRLKLDAGVELSPFQIAYKTYGTLNADRSNAVLVCHVLVAGQGAQGVAQAAAQIAGVAKVLHADAAHLSTHVAENIA